MIVPALRNPVRIIAKCDTVTRDMEKKMEGTCFSDQEMGEGAREL